MKNRTWAWAGLALLLLAPAAPGQEKTETPAPEAARARFTPTPLRVQIVFSKYQGEKKVASLPYTTTCSPRERAPAELSRAI